ncbi:hypothetical protein [Actinomadura sp. HBU206391]|nr:hypothetical protein [Actinomadura sp. HBU206391]
MRLDTSPDPVRVRAAFVTDIDIDHMNTACLRVRLVDGERGAA